MEAKYLELLFIFLISINIIPPTSSAQENSLMPLDAPIIPHFPSVNVRQACNGLFFEPLPLPSNDQFFIGCIKGEGVILQCDGDRIFDSTIRRCIDRSIETTTVEIPTTTPDYNSLCRGLNFNFINHPTDCGIAIFCFNEEAYLRECQTNTIFDINIEQCRSGNRETCEFYDTTTSTTQPPNLDILCNGLDRVFLEHPNDCRRAIFCLNGRAIVPLCRENTIFDIQIGDCRYGNPETCEFYDSTTTAPNYNRLCEGRIQEFITHPTNCSIAIFCFNERAILRECVDETIFDLAREQCRPGNRDTCTFYDSDTIVQPTQFKNDLKGQNGDNLKGLCKGHQFNYIKHPHECDKAIFCYNGYPIIKECPLNHIYDTSTESCKEGNRETCEFETEHHTVPCEEDFLPHETDKSRFYRCKSGVAYSMICENNQVFDVNLSTLRQVLITFLLAFIYCAKAQDNPCSGVWFGRVPHPEICYKYYTCTLQIGTERTCGQNEIFDVGTLECIPGNQQTCEPYTTGSTTPYPTTTFVNTTYSTTTFPVNTTVVSTTTTRTTTTGSTTPGPDIPAICENVFFAARPHPTSNLLYIGCMRGIGVVYQCFDKEEFDPIINECVEICEVKEDICANVRLLGIIKNPCDCAGFVVCYQGKIIDIPSCDPGNIFDESIGDCRPGDPLTCEFYGTTTIGITGSN